MIKTKQEQNRDFQYLKSIEDPEIVEKISKDIDKELLVLYKKYVDYLEAVYNYGCKDEEYIEEFPNEMKRRLIKLRKE